MSIESDTPTNTGTHKKWAKVVLVLAALTTGFGSFAILYSYLTWHEPVRESQPSTETTLSRLDSGNDIYLTDASESASWPAWSPDGRSILYTTANGSKSQMKLVDLEERRGESVFTVPLRQSYQACWSPDGEQIAFIGVGEDFVGLHVMNADGSELECVQEMGLPEHPAWSPNGETIAFSAEGLAGEDAEIFLLNCKSKEISQLTSNSVDDRCPSWSPDGRFILFASEVDETYDLCILDVTDKSIRRLTNGPGNFTNPAWSPDGRFIAFTSDRNGDYNLYLMPSEGDGYRSAFSVGVGNEFPTGPKWSPNGKYIASSSRSTSGDPRRASSWIMLMNVAQHIN